MFRESVLAFLGVKDDPGRPAQSGRTQQIGEYCHGSDLAECRRSFGDALARICATCPE